MTTAYAFSITVQQLWYRSRQYLSSISWYFQMYGDLRPTSWASQLSIPDLIHFTTVVTTCQDDVINPPKGANYPPKNTVDISSPSRTLESMIFRLFLRWDMFSRSLDGNPARFRQFFATARVWVSGVRGFFFGKQVRFLHIGIAFSSLLTSLCTWLHIAFSKPPFACICHWWSSLHITVIKVLFSLFKSHPDFMFSLPRRVQN